MNEEERKAIEELEKFIKGPCETCKYCEGAYKLNRKNIIQLLNLTKKVQKENEEWQRAHQEEKDRQFDLIKENEELKNKLKEKDKIINLTVNHIATSDSYLCQYLDITTKCKYYAGENGNTCDECIKQYFERQAENDTKCT